MSEISLYPQGIDIFTTKVDTTNGQDGDTIMAAHMNRAQNAITAIELSLGTTPQGDSADVAQRLYSLSKSKALTMPRIGMYSGNPLNVNGCTTKEDAARCFTYLSIALLDGIDPYGAVMLDARDVIEESDEIGYTIFYGTIDAGVSTSNLPVADIGSIIDRWKDIGASGIHFSNFGYDSLTSRARQNTLVDLAHTKGMTVIVSAPAIDDVFGIEDTAGMNPTGTETTLATGDGYLFLGYAVQGSSYQNAAELQTLSGKMVAYRSAIGVSMYGIGYIGGADPIVKNRMYYYGQVVSMMYSLNGFHAMTTPITSVTINLYKTLPVVGEYYDPTPDISTTDNVLSRMAGVGVFQVDTVNHTYTFNNLGIPLGIVDFNADDSTIDAGRLTGDLSSNVSIDIINRINTDISGLTIAHDMVDLDGEEVMTAINLAALSPIKIDADCIENLNAAQIEDIVIQVLGEQLEAELLSGELDANMRRLMAQFISAQNAYFTTIYGETGEFNGLNAGVITAGYIDVGLLEANTITSDKLTILGNGGVNKWAATVVQKAVGVVSDPGPVNILGKDPYRTFEAVDSATLVTSSYVGSGLQNYVVLWETNVFCTDTFTFSASLTANSNAKLVINGTTVCTVVPDGTTPYTTSFRYGWNTVQVYQDHNTEVSCTCGIGIKFSDYALATENQSNITALARVDAYSSRATQIIGDVIKTGTLDADRIKANSITAAQIQAGTITTTELNADEVSAGLVDAGMVQAIEAYIQHLSATEGEFENILAELLTTKFIDTSNIKVVSEAHDGTNTGSLVIDNGGMIVSSLPKALIAVSNEVMTNVTGRTYRVVAKWTGMPIAQSPAPSFSLRNISTQEVTALTRDDYALIYEYGQITIDEDISLVGMEALASYSYPDQYYPYTPAYVTPARVVKIDREGIKISNNGGYPGSWVTKLDGTRLYVGSADISEAAIQTAHIGLAQITDALINDLGASKLTAGTIDASVIGVINLSASNITTGSLSGISMSIGTGNAIFKATADGIQLGHANFVDAPFSVDMSGHMTATDATITGNISATTGAIGGWVVGETSLTSVDTKIVLDSSVPSINIDSGKVIIGKYNTTDYGISAIAGKFGSTNYITVDSGGLVLGTGSIVDTRDPDLQNLYISTDGIIAGNINAISGTINGIQITPEGLQAFSAPALPTIEQNITYITENITNVTNAYNNYYLQPGSIRVLGDEAVIIDTGTLVVKDPALVNRVILGKLSETLYGLKFDFLLGSYLQMDKDGFRIYDGTRNTINATSEGDVSITGTIYAEAGELGTLTVTGTITAGDCSIDTTGISGTGYSLDVTGLTATAGLIAGWTIGTDTISKGTMTIDSANEKITTTGVVLGKYDVTDPENPKYGIKAQSGEIGGWTIDATTLHTVNISIESDTELIDIASEVLIGKYDAVTPKYGIKAGDVIIDSDGLYGTGYSLDATGLTATAGSIGGWTINATQIKNTDSSLILDSSDGSLKFNTNKIVFSSNGTGNVGILQFNKYADQPTHVNIVVDGNFPDGDSWTPAASTESIVSNVYSSTGDGTSNYPFIYQNTTTGCVAGHKIYLQAKVRVTNASCLGVTLNVAGTGGGTILTADGQVPPTQNVWYTLSGIVTITDQTGNISVIIGHAYADAATADNMVMEVKEVIGIELSTEYGVGSEPSLATCESIFTTWFDGTLPTYPIYTPNFKLDSNGNISLIGSVTATSGTFSGTIYATAGWFGTEANHVSISGNGLAAGSVVIDNAGLKIGTTLSLDSSGLTIANGSNSSINLGNKFIANSDGITAIAGTIGGWTIGSTTLSANNVTINSAGSIRLDKDADEYVLIDTTNGLQVEGGLLNIKIKDGISDAVTITSAGIWAGNATNHVALNSTGIDIVTATSGAKSLKLNATGLVATVDANNRVELDGDGVRCIKSGTTLGSAITPDGIIGQLLTEQSVAGSKFDKTAPAIPTNVDATQVIEQTAMSEFININVTWTAVTDTDLEGYKVYLKEGTGLYMPMAVVQSGQTSYTIRNVKGATQYYVAVSAYDVTGNESAKSTDEAILTTNDSVAPDPVDINNFFILDGLKMFALRWNPVTLNTNDTPCVDLNYYEIERYDTVTWSPVTKVYTTSIIDKNVAYDTYYSYRIRAVDFSGNASTWTQKDAGEPARVGSGDIVAGSITAEILNVGSMVKNINPNRTILFHYDGVLTSTQDLRPVESSGGAWVDGKFGNAIALEEATTNLISTATSGNSGFSNGTTGWTVDGADYNSTGGISGTDDGCVEVSSTKKISITISGLTESTAYTISLYAKSTIFSEPTDLIVKKGAATIIQSTQRSDWRRVKYTLTTGVGETSATFEFSSLDAREVSIDNVQLEQRDFMTAYTESYALTGYVRPHGWVMYSSEMLNTKQGIISFWYKPNRAGLSPAQTGRSLFYWGTSTTDRIHLSLDSLNKPTLDIVTGATTKTITHANAIDSSDWNLITVRWNCDATTAEAERFMDVTLNGSQTAEEDRISLVGFTAPEISESYFTVGNYNNSTSYSANGYFDELRIDISVDMDVQENEEIISWFSQESTFYDASSQIDADSQGISAANAKVRINNEGITVQDGLIRVISDDGITLIGGGRINVNGMNVGVVQSDNEIYNGNFSVTDTIYGLGDMYLAANGIQCFGARWWRSRRSSGPSYSNVVQQAAWNLAIVNSALEWDEIYTMLFTAYNTAIRANEAATHTIENTIRATEPIASMPEGAEKEALVADMLEDELVYQINTAADSKYEDWQNFGLSVVRYNDINGNAVVKAIRYDIESNVLQYVKHSVDPWTGKFYIDPSEISSTTMLPELYEATEAAGIFGHVTYEVWPEESLMGKTGYAKLGVNPVNGNPTTSVIGAGDGTEDEFTISGAPLAYILAVAVDGVIQIPTVQYSANATTGLVTFTPGNIPGVGAVVTATYNTIDYTHQYTSLEQNLGNLITYTDGLQPEGTHWKQHVFTFYAKWAEKPVGSQSKVYFEVDELVPKYTVDENNMATQIPTVSVATADTLTDQNSFLVANTDFTNGKYAVRLGHATFPEGHENHQTYTLDSVRYAAILPVFNVRYIRDYVNGNTASSGSDWVEIIATDTLGAVVSIGDTVTADAVPDYNSLTLITNGQYANTEEYCSFNSGLHWVQVDLGAAYNLSAITVWHYYGGGRTYHNSRTQVSADGVKWYDVYNSAYQGEYVESSSGHTIGGLSGSTPIPIIVEEVLTTAGEATDHKAGWTINSDGAIYAGMTDAKYIASSKTGDVMMIEFTSDSTIDLSMHVLSGPSSGMTAIYADGQFFAEADTSYPVRSVANLSETGYPAGAHRITVIATGHEGFMTADGVTHPMIALEGVDWYDWTEAVHTTSVEYTETDPTTWNKMIIRPDVVNTKDGGVPVITAENVPIKYRARIRFDKPVNDPFPASVLITGMQAEVGYNESFTRVNYGPGSIPSSMIQTYNKEISITGIGAQHLQEYQPMFLTRETGIQERHIADGQVTTTKLANGAITTDKIAYGNISYEKLALSPKAKLELNVSLSDYTYPIILSVNTNPMIRYIPEEINLGSENIYVNGQLQYPTEDYTIEHVTAAQRPDDLTKIELAAKITFIRTVTATDKVWATYWKPI